MILWGVTPMNVDIFLWGEAILQYIFLDKIFMYVSIQFRNRS